MGAPITDESVQAMVATVVKEVDPERVYLFGSRARGDARDDSDLDLLIVESAPFGPQRSRFEEIERISQVVDRFRIPTDVLVYSSDEARTWANTTNHVVARAMREGRLLYERS